MVKQFRSNINSPNIFCLILNNLTIRSQFQFKSPSSSMSSSILANFNSFNTQQQHQQQQMFQNFYFETSTATANRPIVFWVIKLIVAFNHNQSKIIIYLAWPTLTTLTLNSNIKMHFHLSTTTTERWIHSELATFNSASSSY